MFLRISALFTVSPIFGRRNTPSIAKIGLALFLTYILAGVYSPTVNLADKNLLEFFILCAGQICVGLIMGLVTTFYFSAAVTAGQIIDMQIGFSIASVYDPQYGTPVPLVGNLLNITLLLCFFLADGHHVLLRIIGESFRVIPVGGVVISPHIAAAFTEIFIKTFILAVRVAMPVMAAALVSEVVIGVLMRVVPQLNFFVVGFPVKIGVGLAVLFGMIPVFVNMSASIFDEMAGAVQKIYEGMSP